MIHFGSLPNNFHAPRCQQWNVSVVRLWHALGVSTSGYYAGRQREPSQRARANEALLIHLRAIWVETHETYGSPRSWGDYIQLSEEPCLLGNHVF